MAAQTIEGRKEERREGLFDYQVDVALIKGKAVGFCAYTEEELVWLYVAPEQMRKGIRQRLIKHALCQEPGIRYIEVLFCNEPAKRLYEKMGFQVKEVLSGQMPGNEVYSVQVYCMERTGE